MTDNRYELALLRSVIDGLTRNGDTVGFVEVGTGLLWKKATEATRAA